ncbi:triosephosphate isomerase-like [Penaeus chinensis]|uniref:triosephosphate isomerase-like n=1 Tax=Penaeus chinensis TaxID=139456 RepID=UPI001FB59CF0|nr:triosephosphate isomerase-like [Penaeus chinensis]XP_047473674.1 triosephosphate isomerase-like [Penaeus chinensis]
MGKYKTRVAQRTVDSPRLSGQQERFPMTLRRRTEMSGKRKFLVAGSWTSQADSSAASTRESCSSFLSYARQHLPVEIGTTVPDGHEAEEAFCRNCDCHWEVVGGSSFGSSDSQPKEAIVEAQREDRKIIACLCETSEDREKGRTEDVLLGQMKSLAASISDWSGVVIAFEALWASNTGVLATAAQVQEALANIREWLRANVSEKVANSTRIIYAGSVSSSNCRELAQLEDLDGFLVGSATLRPDIVPAITSSRVSRSSLWATHEALRSTAQLIQQLRQQECARRLAATTRSPKRYI